MNVESTLARDSLLGGLLAAAALTQWLEILFVLLEPAESGERRERSANQCAD